MGFIKSSLFISLDGVIESPETWHFPYFDDQMGAVVGELMNEAEATLLGRHTYEGFASYWPDADPADPTTKVMNSARKYVVSNTLTEATWENSSLIRGDVAAELTRLKDALAGWFDRVAAYAQVKRDVFAAVEAATWHDLAARSLGPIGEAVELLLAAGRSGGSVRADAEARDVIVLISWLSRLDDAELDARGPRLLSILVDGLRAHRP
jgi:hypothetical protein